MISLLDVNVLLAIGHTHHGAHPVASRWLGTLPADAELATCAITELGFVRVSVLAKLQPDIMTARAALVTLKKNTRFTFRLLSDDLGTDTLPAYVNTPAETTDGHLLVLAQKHGARLVTLDAGIPGAFLIPSTPLLE